MNEENRDFSLKLTAVKSPGSRSVAINNLKNEESHTFKLARYKKPINIL